MQQQEWVERVRWLEEGRHDEMTIRVRRKTEGTRDHLLVHRFDDKTGRLLRLGKLEIARRQWHGGVAKGWQSRQLQNVPSVEQLEALKVCLANLAENLSPGSDRKTPAST